MCTWISPQVILLSSSPAPWVRPTWPDSSCWSGSLSFARHLERPRRRAPRYGRSSLATMRMWLPPDSSGAGTFEMRYEPCCSQRARERQVRARSRSALPPQDPASSAPVSGSPRTAPASKCGRSPRRPPHCTRAASPRISSCTRMPGTTRPSTSHRPRVPVAHPPGRPPRRRRRS